MFSPSKWLSTVRCPSMVCICSQPSFGGFQVLNPKTLIGAQLTPPTGVAAEWMWGSTSLDSTLQIVFGPGRPPLSGLAPVFLVSGPAGLALITSGCNIPIKI